MHFTLKAFAARAVRRTSTALALACLAVITALTAETALTDPQTVAARTEVRRFASELLSEERELFVRLPPSYADGAASYPVVYVLDGEWNFDLVASYLDYFADNRLFPEMIVAGIRNVNRNRDYVPRPDPNFPYTGGGEAFYAFLDREWIPYMQAHYRTSGERVLVGHSFGGVATLPAFFAGRTIQERKYLINAAIPSTSKATISSQTMSPPPIIQPLLPSMWSIMVSPPSFRSRQSQMPTTLCVSTADKRPAGREGPAPMR